MCFLKKGKESWDPWCLLKESESVLEARSVFFNLERILLAPAAFFKDCERILGAPCVIFYFERVPSVFFFNY